MYPLVCFSHNNVKETLFKMFFPNYTMDHKIILFLSGVTNSDTEHTDNNNNINIFLKQKHIVVIGGTVAEFWSVYRHFLLCEISLVTDLK